MKSAAKFDVIVVGGGHNGLVAAGLLSRRGAKVLVLERRPITGGAAVTEQPFGPDFQVTSLSYVISLMPPSLVRELELERHGYQVFPQHGYFVPYDDGRYLMLPPEPARRKAQLAKFSAKDAAAIERFEAWLIRLARVLGPLITAVPPRLGSTRPADLLEQAKLAWRVRDLGLEGAADLTRLFTLSVADLLEEYFESPEVLGVMAVSGIIGTWAGPRSAGTAYVMAHHKIGDLGEGPQGSWGFPKGGMGGVTGALRRAAERFGAVVKTEAEVSQILVKDGAVQGVALRNGDAYEAAVVITTTHPQIAFLEQVDRTALPAEFVEQISRWKSRSGVVKINLALDRLPEFKGKPGFDPETHGGTIVLAQSLDDLEGAFQDAASGRAAAKPFADICIPSVFDSTLAPPGKHVMSLFTQWVPHGFAEAPHREELSSYADRVLDRLEQVAPGFKSSILHQQVIGPYEMQTVYGLRGGNIFHGELSTSQLFHLRPAAGFADFRTPIRGLYQASSATHGGGGVTGVPGLNAVRAILKDHPRRGWG